DFIKGVQNEVLFGGSSNYNSKKLCAFRDGSYKPILSDGGKYACKVGLQNDIRFSGTGVPERHRKISLETALRLPERRLSSWK
ncbi:MAG TPA: hypothetical protein VF020_06985, partial [Chthoniobacterales bacterium]